MRARASGFCIYNDVALAIARARRDGLRVLYVDLDVHHGDGVQALHYSDPGVLTISFHETGRSLFPGTGFPAEMGEGIAAGTSVNVPFEPMTGPEPWLAAVEALVPPLAAAFGPDLVVSQHGADGHVWDPLASLSLTTTAMGRAARLVDRVAHRFAGGRWLATGGGGYSIYRAVPRAWALTWLAGAHRDVPGRLPDEWLRRWEGDAARWEAGPMPDGFEDGPGLPGANEIGLPAGEQARRTLELVRTVLMPALLSVAGSRGWWRFDAPASPATIGAAPAAEAPPAARQAPTLVAPLTPGVLDGLTLAPRVIPPAIPAVAAGILSAALADGAVAVAAVSGEWLVGVALAAPTPVRGADRLVALGVAPEWRRRGLATALLRALVELETGRGRALAALHTVAERDPIDPLPRAVRRGVAEELARSAGMGLAAAPPGISSVDPDARLAVASPAGAPGDLQARIAAWLAGR